MDIDDTLIEVQKIIERHAPPGTQTILFGSWAKGDAQPNSDLDVGILAPKLVPFEIITRIRNEVEAIPTLRKIDVVDLNAVDAPFREAALAHHRVLTPSS